MSTLFEPLRVGDIELDNRVIMAPMTRSRADEEGVQPAFAAEYYRQRASAGLIITAATNISPMAKGYVRPPGIYTTEQVESWRNITQAVHARGGKIFLQVFHTGRIALPDFLPNNTQPVAPSAVRAKGKNYTDEGMKEFANAAANGITAGFDGVELHSASGYLVQQFLTTNVNLRTDEYGGSIENRTRFLFAVLDAMASEIGSQRLAVKFSPQLAFNDLEELDADEVYPYIMEHLGDRKLAYVHVADVVSAGWHAKLRRHYNGIYFANGGFTGESGAELLAQGGADAIVFGTKFLANPDLPERIRRGAPLNSPDRSTFYSPGERGYTDYPTLD